MSSGEFVPSNFPEKGQNGNNDFSSTNATLKYALDGNKSQNRYQDSRNLNY